MKDKYILIKTKYQKYYRAVIGKDRLSKRTFRTAAQAIGYAERVTSWYKVALLNSKGYGG